MKEIYYKRPASDSTPAIRVLAVDHASPELVSRVQRTVESIDLADRKLFPEPHRQFFTMLRRQGADAAVRTIQEIGDRGNTDLFLRKQDVLHRLGSEIFKRLPSGFFPYHDVEVVPRGNEWLVRIKAVRSMRVPKEGKGTEVIYYSARKPTIEIDGKKRIVAFNKHAAEETCYRIYTSTWRSYFGNADVFAFFADCVHFERAYLHPCPLNPSGLSFTFYNTCTLGSFRAEIINVPNEYALKVIGFSAMVDFRTKGTQWFYRVGYASAYLSGDFIVAKTLLHPGHRTTPEFGAVLNSPLDQNARQSLLTRAQAKYQIDDLLKSLDFSMIKWFHDQGIPQVVSLPHDIFAASLDDDK